MKTLDPHEEELELQLLKAVALERDSSAAVIERIIDFDKREVWKKLGHASLYRYCLDKLGYTAGQANRRIQAARAAQKHPIILASLRKGDTCLEAINALAAHLTPGNVEKLLAEAKGKTVLEVQALVAGPDKGVRLTLLLSPGLLKAVERVRGLLWHKNPSAKIEDAVEETVEFYLDKRDPERRAVREEATSRQPSPGRSLEPSRRIPQAVKDEVWHRDGGRCAFVRPDGSRCVEQKGLEYDHIVPFALGGPSNRARNIRLLCWGHNQMEMRRRFGARA